jgi:hypothetical protein
LDPVETVGRCRQDGRTEEGKFYAKKGFGPNPN